MNRKKNDILKPPKVPLQKWVNFKPKQESPPA